jgi:hypothetical protein
MEKNSNMQANQRPLYPQGRGGSMEPNQQYMQTQLQGNQPRFQTFGRGQAINQMPPQAYAPTQPMQGMQHSMTNSALMQTINPGQPGLLSHGQPYTRTNNATGYLQTNAQPYAPGRDGAWWRLNPWFCVCLRVCLCVCLCFVVYLCSDC